MLALRTILTGMLLAGSAGTAAEKSLARTGGDPRATLDRLAEAMDTLDTDAALSCISSRDAPECRALREEIAGDIQRIRLARATGREILEARVREIRERIAQAPEQDRPEIEECLANVEAGLASIDRTVGIRIESEPVSRAGEGWAEVLVHVDGRAVLGAGGPDDLIAHLVLEPAGWRIERIRWADPKRNAAPDLWDRVSRGVREALIDGNDAALRDILVGPGRPLPPAQAGAEFERLLDSLRAAPSDPRPEMGTRYSGFDRARIRVSIPTSGATARTWEMDLRIVEIEGGYGAQVVDVRRAARRGHGG